MTLISGFGPLNYAGCFAATFGSALASYVSCPKLLQMISDDEIFPHYLVGCLGKGYGKSKEPLRAYALTFILALAFVLIGILLDAKSCYDKMFSFYILYSLFGRDRNFDF